MIVEVRYTYRDNNGSSRIKIDKIRSADESRVCVARLPRFIFYQQSITIAMGPRVGRATAYHRRLQAQATNGDVPSSSVAAQLADRLATTRQNCSHQDRESFQLLLREILEESDHVWQADGGANNDAVVSSKLICVIVQAGLEDPIARHPIKRTGIEPSNVLRSLQAIDLTLSRSPDALFQPLDFEFTDRLPLFAWLIPKILAQTRESEFLEIERQVLIIIQHSLSVADRATIRGKRNSQISDYIRGCIAGASSCSICICD